MIRPAFVNDLLDTEAIAAKLAHDARVERRLRFPGDFAARLGVLLKPHVGMLARAVQGGLVAPARLGHQDRLDAGLAEFSDELQQVTSIPFPRDSRLRLAFV